MALNTIFHISSVQQAVLTVKSKNNKNNKILFYVIIDIIAGGAGGENERTVD